MGETLRGHWDEVLDVCFSSAGSRLATASADCTARVYAVMTGACTSILTGHEGEVSKVMFSPNGWKLATASSDRTCRLWSVETGECLKFWKGTVMNYSLVVSTMMAVPSSLGLKITHAVSGRTVCLWQPRRTTKVNVFDARVVSTRVWRPHSETCTHYVGFMV